MIYRFMNRIVRLANKFGRDIKLMELEGIKVYLRVSKRKSSIYVLEDEGYMIDKSDCDRLNKCISISNVSTVYMYLIFKLAGRNMVIVNIPDALLWISKVFGMDMAVSILDMVHEYYETGNLGPGLSKILNMLGLMGINITRRSFENALLPARRILSELRQSSHAL